MTEVQVQLSLVAALLGASLVTLVAILKVLRKCLTELQKQNYIRELTQKVLSLETRTPTNTPRTKTTPSSETSKARGESVPPNSTH